MTPGFYHMPDEEYHATEALSHSGIVRLRISPAHYKIERKVTPALDFGRAFHRAILEPDRFKDEYVEKPEGMSFATKEGKAWKAANDDKRILSFEDSAQIKGMAQAIRNCKTASDLLADGEAEFSGFWNDPQYGFLCKLRMDWVNKGKRVVVDLKKCTDARPEKFTGDAYKYGYHIEAAWYLYGVSQITRVEHRDFFFIAVESDLPHGVRVYRATDEFVNEGLKECNKMIEVYRECREKDAWPCYPDELGDLDLPGWVKRKESLLIMD